MGSDLLIHAIPTKDLTGSYSPERHKLEKAAQEFEGLLLSQLWKGMAEDMKSSMGGDSANSAFTDLGLQAVSAGMASAGGIGVGKILVKALEKQDIAEVHAPKDKGAH